MIFEIFIFLIILVMQNVAVFLDNLGVFFLTKNHHSTELAGIFAKKHQIDFLSRGFLFLIPPLLGFLLTHNELDTLLKIFVYSSFITLIVTILQSKWLFKSLQFKFQLTFTRNKVLMILVGLFVYAVYLYVPFYLNILAYFFKNQALWLVQLSPALTVFTSVFVVYYMDPRIAGFIDSIEINKTPDVVFEMIVMRVIGRVLILAIAILMYFQYAHIPA